MAEPELLKGAPVAQRIRDTVAGEVRAMAERGVVPRLAFVYPRSAGDAAAYAGAQRRACEKTGIAYSAHELADPLEQRTFLEVVAALAADPAVSGILLHSPMPAPLDLREAQARHLAAAKDVEAILPETYGRLATGAAVQAPCTAAAAHELLRSARVPLKGRHAVIVGRSPGVGRALALLLLADRDGPTVTVCHSRTVDLAGHVRRGDFVVAAVGRPRFITADMVKEGAVVIDVGTNVVTDASGTESLVGDVDFDAVVPKCAAITPVPGGVGPVTTACLLRNVVACCRLGSF